MYTAGYLAYSCGLPAQGAPTASPSAFPTMKPQSSAYPTMTVRTAVTYGVSQVVVSFSFFLPVCLSVCLSV